MAVVGALVSAVLGMAAAQSSGSAEQGQSIMMQSMNILASQAAAADTPSDTGDDYSVSMAPTAAGAATNVSAEVGSFPADKYMAGANGSCQESLGYLSSRLPAFPPTEIANVRTAIFNTSMSEVMRLAKAQGETIDSAISKSILAAKEHDNTAREALSTASQVDAFGIEDEQFERDIKSGKITLNSCSGIHDAALCAAIANKYGAIASRAVAANLMCYKRTGNGFI